MVFVLLVAFYTLMPLVILHLCHRFPFVNKLGAVFIAYMVGLVLGNTGILPGEAKEVQDLLTTLTIPLSIPLLLFSANIKRWRMMAGKALLALVIGLFSVVIVVVAGFFLFKGRGMADLWKVAGMLVGVYSGGTPNLASLKVMLGVDSDIYILTHTYDMVISTLFLFFLITVGKRFFLLFLSPYRDRGESEERDSYGNGNDPFWGIFRRKVFIPLLKAYGLALAIFAVAGAISLLFSKEQQVVVVILTITTLSITASTFKRINSIEKTYESGIYLILIFSIVVASMADISKFAGLTPGLFGYITLAVFGSLILQVGIGRFFGIDADTTIITSTALICSPPFVPVVAASIGNRKVIVTGITVGIIGYAVGNYLGFLIAETLQNFC